MPTQSRQSARSSRSASSRAAPAARQGKSPVTRNVTQARSATTRLYIAGTAYTPQKKDAAQIAGISSACPSTARETERLYLPLKLFQTPRKGSTIHATPQGISITSIRAAISRRSGSKCRAKNATSVAGKTAASAASSSAPTSARRKTRAISAAASALVSCRTSRGSSADSVTFCTIWHSSERIPMPT